MTRSATTRDYRKLEVWSAAHANALAVYEMTANFPADQRFSLVQQMQRAAVSVPANIAEGCGRGGEVELKRFLQIAAGSNAELEYFVHLSHDLGYVTRDQALDLYRKIQSVGKMLHAYAKPLNATPSSQQPAASSP